ncbi:MAG: alpha/beta fold hydrolase [Chloroflexota bacterium]|nr:MAG: alpha/beta fold hydrolase [Chloroflexota bacterium]
MRRDIEFKSCGETCRGHLYLPDDVQGPVPGVIVAMGGGYTLDMPMITTHATAFQRAGFASIVFDYRHNNTSDGHPRNHCDPWKQVEDCRNAISFAETLPELDPGRLGIWGISMGGGYSLAVAAMDPRVRCAISVVGLLDGYENLRRIHGIAWFNKMLEAIMEDRRTRFANEEKRAHIPLSTPKPFQELAFFPVSDAKDYFEEQRGHRHEWTMESMELIINYSVLPLLPRILHTPVSMIIVEGDDHTPWEMQVEAFNNIPSTRKELTVVPQGSSHMRIYTEPEYTKIVVNAATGWLNKYLGEQNK